MTRIKKLLSMLKYNTPLEKALLFLNEIQLSICQPRAQSYKTCFWHNYATFWRKFELAFTQHFPKIGYPLSKLKYDTFNLEIRIFALF